MSGKYLVLMAFGASVVFGAGSLAQAEDSTPSPAAQSAARAEVAKFEANPQKFLAEAKKDGKSVAAVVRDLVIADPSAAGFIAKFAGTSGDAVLQASIGAGLGQAASALTNSGNTDGAKAVQSAAAGAATSGDTALSQSFTASSGGTQTASLGTPGGATPGAAGGPTGGPGGNGGSVGGPTSPGGTSSASPPSPTPNSTTNTPSSTPSLAQGTGTSVSSSR